MSKGERTFWMFACGIACMYMLACGVYFLATPGINFNSLATGSYLFVYLYVSGLCLIAAAFFGGLTYSHRKKLQHPWL